MKIAIIGQGLTALACAIECEKLGVVPDVFGNDGSVGWVWPSVNILINIFLRDFGDITNELKKSFGLDIVPLIECKKMVLKSPNKEVNIGGKLGYLFIRGKHEFSLENQLRRQLKRTPINFSSPVDYKELAKKYDYVVVASGTEWEAKELGVWQDFGKVHMIEGLVTGKFDPYTITTYWDTEYAGTGYARITPFSSSQAIAGLYAIGFDPLDIGPLYEKFRTKENLQDLLIQCKYVLPPFSTGRVNTFKIGNVLLAGRSAGLTERLMGGGAAVAMMSGVLAARAVIEGKDYDSLMNPLRNKIEKLSAFRDLIENFKNDDFDKLLTLIGTPGIKQLVYNTEIDFADMAGSILRMLHKK